MPFPLSPRNTTTLSPSESPLDAYVQAVKHCKVSAASFEEMDQLLSAGLKAAQEDEAKLAQKIPEADTDPVLVEASKGVFDMRSKVGSTFYDEHPNGSEKHREYMALGDMKAKKLYRAKWAQEKYAWVEASRSMTEQYSKVSLEVGEMMTFGQLVQSYGGWEWSEAVDGSQGPRGKMRPHGWLLGATRRIFRPLALYEAQEGTPRITRTEMEGFH